MADRFSGACRHRRARRGVGRVCGPAFGAYAARASVYLIFDS